MSEMPACGSACSYWARAIRKSGVSHSSVGSACDASTSVTSRSLRTWDGGFAALYDYGGERRTTGVPERHLAEEQRDEEGEHPDRHGPEEDRVQRVREGVDQP